MKKNRFTLVEFIVLMAIIAILAAIIVPNVARYQISSRINKIVTGIEAGETPSEEDIRFLEETRWSSGRVGADRLARGEIPEDAFESTKVFHMTLALAVYYKDSPEGHLKRQVFWFSDKDDYEIDEEKKTIFIKQAVIEEGLGRGRVRTVENGTFSYLYIHPLIEKLLTIEDRS